MFLKRKQTSLLILFSIICQIFWAHCFASASHPLANTTWDLVNITSMNDEVDTPNPKATFQLTINANGKFTAVAGCKTAMGDWRSPSTSQILFDEINIPESDCPYGLLQDRFLDQFKWVRSYVLKQDRLFLATMADGAIIEFKKRNDKTLSSAQYISAEDGGPLNWQLKDNVKELRLYEAPATSSKVVHVYSQDAILDNLGCQRKNGNAWCYVQQLGGGPVGYVEAKQLKPAIAPSGEVIMGPDDTALRAGQGDFDATGKLPCAVQNGQPMTQCDFGVARLGGGYATVVVTKPDNRTRILFFRFGQAIGASTAQADNPGAFSVTKESDLFMIRLGAERYEVPEAVIFGG